MKLIRTLLLGLALPACLLSACVADEDDGSLDELESLAAAVTSAPPRFTSLASTPTGMRLGFTTNDPATTRLIVYKMDREEGYYRHLGGVPINPTGQYGYDDPAVVLGHEYCYQIGSFAEGQTRGSNSEALCAVHTGGTQNLPPAAPTGLRVERSYERTLRLAFEDASSDETSFELERRSGASWHTIASLPAHAGTGTTYTRSDEDLDIEQTYCYRVRAIGANGSSLSNAVCGRTKPVIVGEPVPGVQAQPVTITHPRAGALNLTWIDKPAVTEWNVLMFDGMSQTPIGNARIRDHVELPPGTTVRHEGYTVENLEPGRLYCFQVTHGYLSYVDWLCESPSAARSSDEPLDPRPEQTPTITAVNAPRNGRLEISIANPQPGQILERIVASDGKRRDINRDDAGSATLVDTNLSGGATYCYRLFVFNQWGARYSNILCGTTSANVPDRPRNLHVAGQSGTTVQLDWDNSANAESYELHYDGTRPHYTDHDGNKSTSSSSYNFEGYESFTYCFKVRAKNGYGSSDWSSELCGVSIADDHLTTYSTALVHDTPPQGIVLYWHNVDPGLGGPGHLVSVQVVGNGFTPYKVHFLPLDASRNDCGNPSKGVIVDAGNTLTGADMARVYGTNEPATPLTLVGCKLITDGTVGNLNDIPINVTYRQ
jgi:hypothetical protein